MPKITSLHLLGLLLGLRLARADCLLYLQVVLLQETFETQRILFQHLLRSSQRLLPAQRALLELANLGLLYVERHLGEEDLPLLGDEVFQVLPAVALAPSQSIRDEFLVGARASYEIFAVTDPAG